MARLKNIQQERFAQFVALGLPRAEAYKQAGYKGKPNNKQRLRKQVQLPAIKARIAELNAKAAARTEVTVERIIRELALIAFANLQDYMTIGPDGQPILDWSTLTRDQAAALSEVTTEDTEYGRKTRFKMNDKQAALMALGKRFGLFGPDLSVNAVIVNQGQHGQDAASLVRIIMGIIDQRNKGDAPPVIEHEATPSPPEPAPLRLVEPSAPPPDDQPTTTEKFLAWQNSARRDPFKPP